MLNWFLACVGNYPDEDSTRKLEADQIKSFTYQWTSAKIAADMNTAVWNPRSTAISSCNHALNRVSSTRDTASQIPTACPTSLITFAAVNKNIPTLPCLAQEPQFAVFKRSIKSENEKKESFRVNELKICRIKKVPPRGLPCIMGFVASNAPQLICT